MYALIPALLLIAAGLLFGIACIGMYLNENKK